MATHSSLLAWKISQTEEPGRPQSMWLQESDTSEHLCPRLPAVSTRLCVVIVGQSLGPNVVEMTSFRDMTSGA